jgi:hypothetical protein
VAGTRADVEGSLRRLGTHRTDLYCQHRVVPNTPGTLLVRSGHGGRLLDHRGLDRSRGHGTDPWRTYPRRGRRCLAPNDFVVP